MSKLRFFFFPCVVEQLIAIEFAVNVAGIFFFFLFVTSKHCNYVFFSMSRSVVDLILRWREKNPAADDEVQNRELMLRSVKASTLKQYNAVASVYALLHETPFPVTVEKLATFIRFRVDQGLNVETTRKYVYALTSLNRLLGYGELDKGCYTRISKLLAAARNSGVNVEPRQARVFGLGVLRKLASYRGRSTVRVAVLLGLSLALRIGELLAVMLEQLSCDLSGDCFVLSVRFERRKNRTSVSWERVSCVVVGCTSELECPKLYTCPAHLVWSLKKFQECNGCTSGFLFGGINRESFIVKLKSLLIAVGELDLLGYSGYSIRRSALQAYFGLSVPEFIIHERAGWMWRESQINRYLRESARSVLTFSARWLFGFESFSESLTRLGLSADGFLVEKLNVM